MPRAPLLAVLTACLAATCAMAAEPTSAGAKLLAYLHGRGEALHIAQPQPVKAVYMDWRDVDWTHPQNNLVQMANASFNVLIVCFYLSSTGPADFLQAWEGVDAATQNATMAYVHSQGAVVLASAGGATDEPFTKDAATFGKAAAQWAVDNQLDGVDFDLENLAPGFTFGALSGAQVVDWMVTATQAARSVLGKDRFVTHAPQAPYFGAVGDASSWVGATGGYTAVWAQCMGAISWLHVQFYNQGPTCYTSYASLFTASNANGSCPSFPGTSVAEIHSYGIPVQFIVVGKPLTASDSGTGWVNASDLASWVGQAAQPPLRWAAGVFVWSWQTATAAAWIRTVYPNGTGSA